MEYELKRSDLCLCGSGKRFGQCCFNYIDSRESDIKRHMDNGDYVKAFKSLNGQLTNYLVKVIRHTKQALLEKQNEAANAWLIIDINAIDEIVNRHGRNQYGHRHIPTPKFSCNGSTDSCKLL